MYVNDTESTFYPIPLTVILIRITGLEKILISFLPPPLPLSLFLFFVYPGSDAHTLDWRIQCNLWVMFWADIHLSNMSSSEQQRSAYVSSLDL